MNEVSFDKLMKYKPAEPGRYMLSSDVKGNTYLSLAPKGHCNWCGKKLSGRCTRFCPPVTIGHDAYHQYEQRQCADRYFGYWYAIPAFKRAIYIRDKFACRICGLMPERDNGAGLTVPDLGQLAIDHIRPYSKGGKTVESNLQVLCRRCNSKKRAIIGYNAHQPELIKKEDKI